MTSTGEGGAAEGRSYLTLGANVKEKPGCDEPVTRALIERCKSGAKNRMHGVVATLIDSTNSYSKQEINPEMLKRAKVAKPHIPEEHERDNKDFTDERIGTVGQMGATPAMVALSKTGDDRLLQAPQPVGPGGAAGRWRGPHPPGPGGYRQGQDPRRPGTC